MSGDSKIESVCSERVLGRCIQKNCPSNCTRYEECKVPEDFYIPPRTNSHTQDYQTDTLDFSKLDN